MPNPGPWQRIAPWRVVALEAPTSKDRRIRIAARAEPTLTFDAFDPVTGEVLGRIAVWNADPALAMRPRLLESDDWALDSIVEAEIHTVDAKDRLIRVKTRQTGTLAEIFDRALTYLPWGA